VTSTTVIEFVIKKLKWFHDSQPPDSLM